MNILLHERPIMLANQSLIQTICSGPNRFKRQTWKPLIREQFDVYWFAQARFTTSTSVKLINQWWHVKEWSMDDNGM